MCVICNPLTRRCCKCGQQKIEDEFTEYGWKRAPPKCKDCMSPIHWITCSVCGKRELSNTRQDSAFDASARKNKSDKDRHHRCTACKTPTCIVCSKKAVDLNSSCLPKSQEEFRNWICSKCKKKNSTIDLRRSAGWNDVIS